MEIIFSIKFYPYGIGPTTGKCASIVITLFPGDLDNLLQWPFSKLIHIGIHDQLDPLNNWMTTVWLDQDPAYKKPTISTKKKKRVSTMIQKKSNGGFSLLALAANMLGTSPLFIDCMNWQHDVFLEPIWEPDLIIFFLPD